MLTDTNAAKCQRGLDSMKLHLHPTVRKWRTETFDDVSTLADDLREPTLV